MGINLFYETARSRSMRKKKSVLSAERALKDAGGSYKRPKKSMPFTALSKEEKLLRVNTILSEVKEMISKEQTEVFAVDASHFSTEPCLIKG